MTILFLHGVPDTPEIWRPLLRALQLPPGTVRTPAMPGFGTPYPQHFIATKEGYLDWLLRKMEDATAEAGGPIDMVGHDWGALLVLRAAALRPDLVRSWAVANAVPYPDYSWHTAAKCWQTPGLGELFMAVTRAPLLRRSLERQGVPADIARLETRQWNRLMKRSILTLYRSAIDLATDWSKDLGTLPERGLVIWGDQDPYVPVEIAKAFIKKWNTPLHLESGAGHWAIAERADAIADRLTRHWAS